MKVWNCEFYFFQLSSFLVIVTSLVQSLNSRRLNGCKPCRMRLEYQ